MTKIYELPRRDRRYDEASLWIARLDKDLSAEEVRALQAWMSAEPDNKAVLLSMARTWDKMDSLSRLSELFPVPAGHRGRITQHGLGIAASILVAVLAGAWAVVELSPLELLWNPENSAVIDTSSDVYETAVGEQSTVMLPDGSHIVLNTNSLLRVEYTAGHRLLILERGEINVKVAENMNRPLSVVVGDQIVQAVGTQFNVEIKEDQKIELVVTEGRVRVGVRRQGPDRAQVPPEVLTESSLMVSAGEELILGTADEEVTPVSPEEIEVKLSWRNGNLVFRGESLEEALEEVGRYTSVEFVFLDDDLRKQTVAGLFKAGDVDGLLAVLRENFDIVYERVDEQTVLLDRE
jgi:transmembrane sensor